MATEVGRTDPSLTHILFERPYEFDFFQAVRLLRLIYPTEQLISRHEQSHSELVRFHSLLSMSFPPSSVYGLLRDREGCPIHMTVAFMGLTGPQGVLPSPYTEFLIARRWVKDDAASAFFDLFNHRLISLFYLAWEKHNLPAAYEHERVAQSKRDGLSEYIFDLFGMGTAGLRNRLKVPDEALRLYSGLLAQRPHSATALAGILREYFQIPVEIKQFAGKWFTLPESDLSYLSPEGLHNQLGFGAIAGHQVWNQQAGFVVQLGPLEYGRFLSFLPDGNAFAKLVSLTRYFVDQALDFDVQLILRGEAVPWCRLSDEPEAPRLGWSTWLKMEAFEGDAQDTMIATKAEIA